MKKTTRILAILLIVMFFISTTGAYAANYTKTTRYRLVTCGDKLLRKTTVYIKNTTVVPPGRAGWIVVEVEKMSKCGSSRNICIIYPGQTGAITFYTAFGQVGEVVLRVSYGGTIQSYSCSFCVSDGSPLVRIG